MNGGASGYGASLFEGEAGYDMTCCQLDELTADLCVPVTTSEVHNIAF
jgi:hypothetical protein